MIHPTAIVEKGAKIGQETKIWPFSYIMKGAKIGKNCNLGQNVFVEKGAKIGNYVRVHNNVSIYDGVVLDDYVFCGPGMIFTNELNPRAKKESEHIKTVVKEGASIGAGAVILCGKKLGKYCFVGAGAVVAEDVPDYAVVVGVPAKIVGWMCECGKGLQFEGGRAICRECSKKYSKKEKAVRLKK